MPESPRPHTFPDNLIRTPTVIAHETQRRTSRDDEPLQKSFGNFVDDLEKNGPIEPRFTLHGLGVTAPPRSSAAGSRTTRQSRRYRATVINA
jgi:hypothetical protein